MRTTTKLNKIAPLLLFLGVITVAILLVIFTSGSI